MAPLVTTLAGLITRAKKRSDMENSAFLATADWEALANDAQIELWDLLVRTHEDYFEKTMTPFATVSGTEDYALPTDFLKLLSVDVQISGSSDWRELHPYHPQNRNDVNGSAIFSLYSGTVRWYRIVGEYIRLKPTPTAAETVRIRYVKRPEELTTGASFESPLLSHWSEHMVLTMAISALNMEESDASKLEARKADIERKIERTAKDRDASFAIRVADIRGRDELDDEDWPLWP